MILNSYGKFDATVIMENGEDTIQFLIDNPLDGSWHTIILLDSRMAVMSGEDFVKAFMQLPSGAKGNYEFLIFSNATTPEQWVKDRRLPYYIKPVLKEALLTAMGVDLTAE